MFERLQTCLIFQVIFSSCLSIIFRKKRNSSNILLPMCKSRQFIKKPKQVSFINYWHTIKSLFCLLWFLYIFFRMEMFKDEKEKELIEMLIDISTINKIQMRTHFLHISNELMLCCCCKYTFFKTFYRESQKKN